MRKILCAALGAAALLFVVIESQGIASRIRSAPLLAQVGLIMIPCAAAFVLIPIGVVGLSLEKRRRVSTIVYLTIGMIGLAILFWLIMTA